MPAGDAGAMGLLGGAGRVGRIGATWMIIGLKLIRRAQRIAPRGLTGIHDVTLFIDTLGGSDLQVRIILNNVNGSGRTNT